MDTVEAQSKITQIIGQCCNVESFSYDERISIELVLEKAAFNTLYLMLYKRIPLGNQGYLLMREYVHQRVPEYSATHFCTYLYHLAESPEAKATVTRIIREEEAGYLWIL